MRITEAAQRLDMTARMLRYRESLGLLPALRHGARPGAGTRGDGRRSADPGSAHQPGAGRGATDPGSAHRPGAGRGATEPAVARPGADRGTTEPAVARPGADRGTTEPAVARRRPGDQLLRSQMRDDQFSAPAGASSLRRPSATGAAVTRHAGPSGQHRQFSDADLAAVALGLSIERRYDIGPAELAFGIRVLADPRVRADVADFGRRIGRIQPPPARALDFEQERAQRLLRLDQRPASGRLRLSNSRP
jgi:MerR family transcriptional regulator, copper efflux regulator